MQECAKVVTLKNFWGHQPPGVLLHEPLVWELDLRVLVQHFHVRMGRGAVQVEVVLLAVLAVVSLGPGKTEQPLLDDVITLIPQPNPETRVLKPVAHPAKTILVPPVRPGPRVVMGE